MMRRFTYILITTTLLSGLLLACEPESGNEVVPDEPIPEQPTPEEPQLPENPLSTLEGDVEVQFSADDSLSYADCFGNYYDTNSYMWGLYFQNYTSKEQIYIEIMDQDYLFEIPLGTYTASDDIYSTGCLSRVVSILTATVPTRGTHVLRPSRRALLQPQYLVAR